MRTLFITLSFIFSNIVLADSDPWGLSEYVGIGVKIQNHHEVGPHHETRLTNRQVEFYRSLGFIDKNGDVTPKGAQAVVRKPLPTPAQVARQTGTVASTHPNSKGTVTVRPTAPHPKISANASQAEINQMHKDVAMMQNNIAHVEKQVAKALDLSLSAYAVAELPQATGGRSSINVGLAASDGKIAEAIGYSKNWGANHEYTIKINLSHAGHQSAGGFGFGYQW